VAARGGDEAAAGERQVLEERRAWQHQQQHLLDGAGGVGAAVENGGLA
jgi:hypothetical protein